MDEIIETPDTKIAQHIGFLTLRVIALEHEVQRLRKLVPVEAES